MGNCVTASSRARQIGGSKRPDSDNAVVRIDVAPAASADREPGGGWWVLGAVTFADMTIDDGRRSARSGLLDLEAEARREQRESRVPSVVLGTARAGTVCEVSAVGKADVQSGPPAETSVPYRIGSITKTFTAAVVLGLAAQGFLALDAPVDRYLPGTAVGEVLVRSLLAHSGGVAREVPVDMWASMRGPDREQLRSALAGAELVDRPGARWHYSNLGYAVLGQVVEEVTGTDCASVIDTRLLGPLGLSATSWRRPPGAAVGYRVDPYADVVHREPDMDQAAVGVAGQLWSTVGDLLVWGDALAGGRPDVVSPGVVEAMHTVQVMVDRSGWSSGWGLGLILDRRGEQVTAGHTGAMPGFLSALSLDRGTRSVAVVLSNATRGASVGRLAAEIIDDLIGTAPAAVGEPWTPAGEVPAELDGVLGRWWSEADETVFTWRAGGLNARLVTGPAAGETRFERVGAHSYRAVSGRLTGERLFVRRDRVGVVTGLEWATYPFTRTPR